MDNLKLKPDTLEIKLTELEQLKLAETGQRPKPRWMLNNAIEDNVWLIARSGFDIPSKPPFRRESYSKLSYHKEIAPGKLLTDKENSELLNDLKNSFIYLSLSDIVSRPVRFRDLLGTVVRLIRHANELRQSAEKKTFAT